MLGPIDYIVVGFEGNNFDGSILDELSQAVKNKTIRVIDIVFIVKGEDGTVLGGEVTDQNDELRAVMQDITGGDSIQMLTEEDIDKIGAQMANDTAAGVLVVEQLWAKGLKRAVLDAGGFLIDDGRIHPDIVAGAMEELEVAEGQPQKTQQTQQQHKK